jgi:hypothetical protein
MIHCVVLELTLPPFWKIPVPSDEPDRHDQRNVLYGYEQGMY